jgi:uncharacterized protein involved in exopolysaccharide biosynthesis
MSSENEIEGLLDQNKLHSKCELKESNINSMENDEINLKEIFQEIKKGKTVILFSIIVFGFLGFLYSILASEEYTAKVVLLPEISSEGGAGLLNKFSGLASLGGVNLDGINKTEAIRPDIYPDITRSLPALIAIMEENVRVPSLDTTISVYTYLNDFHRPPINIIKKNTIGLPRKVISFFKNKNDDNRRVENNDFTPISLSKEQEEIVDNLSKRIATEIDKKSGLITFKVKMPDPYVAAYIANFTSNYLTKYVVNYRLGKAENNYNFILERFKDAENKFNTAQKKLAEYKDKNYNVISSSAKIEGELLQAEYNLAFNLYNSISQQLEQARIKVSEETPVFKVLEPVKIPLEKSEPQKIVIIFLSLTLGGLFSSFYIIIKTQIFK